MLATRHGSENVKLCNFLMLHRALWNLYTVQSPTNALFIKLGNV